MLIKQNFSSIFKQERKMIENCIRSMLPRLLRPKTFARHYLQLTRTGSQASEDRNVDGTSHNKSLQEGPSLEHFIANHTRTGRRVLDANPRSKMEKIPYIRDDDIQGKGRKVYFDVHGCQMNTSDTEVAWAILQQKGYQRTMDISQADVILVMTCAIREGAEQKIRKKLHYLGKLKRRAPMKKGGVRMKIGILGCMAERLKTQLLEEERMVDIVCGPDAYKDLPRLLAITTDQQAAVNVMLSMEETYADVTPVRLDDNAVSAYVSIMRGCDNMCSYCIVPFTRGRERSRPIASILDEVWYLNDQGYREITLLGQNVNSYRDMSQSHYHGNHVPDEGTKMSEGFDTIYKPKVGGRRFAELLHQVAHVNPDLRIRFTAPHPKDFPDEVLQLIKERPNICRQLHLPAQSGNTTVLQAMRRGYTVDAYLKLVDKVRSIIPDVCITSDIISGFCGETDEAHRDTVNLLGQVQYSMVYAYPYSMRKKTHAYHKLQDDVPEDVKSHRYKEVLQVFRQEAEKLYSSMIGQLQLVLVEGRSKKSSSHMFGRNDGGVGVVVPFKEVQAGNSCREPEAGDFLLVKIVDATSHTLYGEGVEVTTISEWETSQQSLVSLLDT